MRNIRFVFLAGLLALSLTACAQPEPAAGGEVPFDALYNPESGAVIALGMTQAQAEERLGEGTYQKPITYLPGQMEFTPTKGMTGFGQTGAGELTFVVTDQGTATYVYGQGEGRLVLTYREGTVSDICPHSLYGTRVTQPFRWQTAGEITYGSTLADLEACWPQGTLWESELTMDGKPLSLYIALEEEDALYYSLTEEDGVVSVSLSDNGKDFAKYMEQDSL
ncbi:MAG: hypothetical protein IKU62_08850 [Ruminiclostridium sp.]|nr:hypothetical protein [Ruminiclostridium sp.]